MCHVCVFVLNCVPCYIVFILLFSECIHHHDTYIYATAGEEIRGAELEGGGAKCPRGGGAWYLTCGIQSIYRGGPIQYAKDGRPAIIGTPPPSGVDCCVTTWGFYTCPQLQHGCGGRVIRGGISSYVWLGRWDRPHATSLNGIPPDNSAVLWSYTRGVYDVWLRCQSDPTRYPPHSHCWFGTDNVSCNHFMRSCSAVYNSIIFLFALNVTQFSHQCCCYIKFQPP